MINCYKYLPSIFVMNFLNSLDLIFNLSIILTYKTILVLWIYFLTFQFVRYENYHQILPLQGFPEMGSALPNRIEIAGDYDKKTYL